MNPKGSIHAVCNQSKSWGTGDILREYLFELMEEEVDIFNSTVFHLLRRRIVGGGDGAIVVFVGNDRHFAT